MIRLGDLYRKGLGVEQSDFLAYDYYTKAFQSDCLDTLRMVLPRLEECYSSGIGVEKDRLIAGLISRAEYECINGNITDAFLYIRAAREAKTKGPDVLLFIAIILLLLIIKKTISENI